MNTIMTTLVAGAAIAMTSLETYAGVQYDSYGSSVVIEYVNEDAGDTSFDAATLLDMGTAFASTATTPNGTVFGSLGWLDGEDGFQFSGGIQHDQISDGSTYFIARAESVMNFTLDEAMLLDFSYIMDVDGADLDFGTFALDRGDDNIYSLGVFSGFSSSDSLYLAAGDYQMRFALLGGSSPGELGSGELSWTMDFRFSSVPAPGALALLGLAGLSARRRRR